MKKKKTKVIKGSSGKNAKERRSALRRPILDTFSFFLILPETGFFKLRVHDLSEKGIGFDFDIEDAPKWDHAVSEGDELDTRFFINQSLYIPLQLKVKRIDETIKIRRVGAEFIHKNEAEFKAFLSFVDLLDRILESLEIDPTEAKYSR